MVHLEKITKDNYRACLGLKVADHQAGYVNTNAVNLARAYVYHPDVVPMAIYNDDEMVGLILIRINDGGVSYFIWQLMVDEQHQGSGFGKHGIQLAIEWVKQDARCERITTTYSAGNDRAARLYASLGFVPMEEQEEDGEIDLVLWIR